MGTLFPANLILHWKQVVETRGGGLTVSSAEGGGGGWVIDDAPVARCEEEDVEGGYQDISRWIEGWRVMPDI